MFFNSPSDQVSRNKQLEQELYAEYPHLPQHVINNAVETNHGDRQKVVDYLSSIQGNESSSFVPSSSQQQPILATVSTVETSNVADIPPVTAVHHSPIHDHHAESAANDYEEEVEELHGIFPNNSKAKIRDGLRYFNGNKELTSNWLISGEELPPHHYSSGVVPIHAGTHTIACGSCGTLLSVTFPEFLPSNSTVQCTCPVCGIINAVPIPFRRKSHIRIF